MKFLFNMTMRVMTTVTMTMLFTMSNAFTLPTSTNSFTTTSSSSNIIPRHHYDHIRRRRHHHRTTNNKNKLNMVVDPISVNVGIAVVSAAAGAATQFPKIQELERELEIAKLALTESEAEMVAKMKDLEDRLFTLDAEYEAQTARFKKQYDNKMQEQLREAKEKIKQDFQYKLDIKIEEERSAMLKEKYDFINSQGNRSQELFGLRLKQKTVSDANAQLEKALQESEAELARLRSESEKRGKKRFLFF